MTLVVAMTDLFIRLPPRPPPCPVIWVTPENHGDVPWGRSVCLN
jgi:hypothetical protein